MPSKLNDSFEPKSPYNPEIVAGAYAHRRMEEFVNVINAASYPQTPFQTGGKVYKYCDDYLSKCVEIIGDDDPSSLPAEKKVKLRLQAVESLNGLVQSLSSDKTLNSTEQQYLDEFIYFKEVTDKLLAGENMESLRQFIQTAHIGTNPQPEPK